MKKIKVIQYGLGAMGAGMVKMMLEKEGFELVGAISASGRNTGADVGEVIGLGAKTGVLISGDAEKVLKSVEADVVLHATCTAIEDTVRETIPVLRAGKNVVTIAEEALFPLSRNKEQFDLLDKTAEENGVTILGTGVNPGFMMDFLPLSMTGIMVNVEKVRIQRVVNYGRYGKSVWDHIGVGKDIKAFNEGVNKGEIILHVGLEQTTAICAAALGWKLDKVTVDSEPTISRTLRKTEFGSVQPGEVGGFKQSAKGWKNGEAVLIQDLIGLIDPDEKEDGIALGNDIWLEGNPSVHVTMGGDFADQGGKGTYARAVNALPQVVAAKPGFKTIMELPPSVCLKNK
jgi:4-hydroxy-tetrahydrodipicolinate reductase